MKYFILLSTILILIILVVLFTTWRFEKNFKDQVEDFLLEDKDLRKVQRFDLDGKPQTLIRWIENTGSLGQPVAPFLQIDQDLELRLKPEQKTWQSATALQVIRYEDPGFLWRITMPIIWPLKVLGVDRYLNQTAHMKMTLAGLVPLGEAKPNSKLNEAAGQRFISELIWYPPAALLDHFIWKQSDKNVLEVSLKAQPSVSGRVYFNEDSLPVRFETNRYYESNDDSKRLKWTCRVHDYANYSGLIVPSKCTVHWTLDTGDWEWLRLKITDLAILDSSSAPHHE